MNHILPSGPDPLALEGEHCHEGTERDERAERLEKLGLLASGIAHDLNNIFSPMMLAPALLRPRATHPEDREVLGSLEKSLTRGGELVRRLLAYAQGATPAKARHMVTIPRLLADAAADCSASFPASILIDAEIPSNLWPVLGDATELYQLMLNLCVNARDAMPFGGRLGISGHNQLLDEAAAAALPGARPGAWVVLEVQDQGTGIAPAVLSRIWEPFFTTKLPGQGTGLGLSIVRGVVKSHGGFVAVRSLVDQGTTFRIFLPAADSLLPMGLRHDAGQNLRGHGELVLVAEADPEARAFIAAALERNGYAVTTALDGPEAVAVFATRGPEVKLVVADVFLPHLDGAALAQVIRCLNATVPILGVGGRIDAARGDARRFTGPMVFKPFKATTLLEAVASLLHSVPPAT